MAQTYHSRQLRHERNIESRFDTQAEAMGAGVSAIVNRYAQGVDRVVPNLRTVKARIKAQVWGEVLKPYHIGNGDDPFDGSTPQSTYARLLYDGIYGSTEIQVERQKAIVQNVTRNDDLVYRWLTGSRPHSPVFEIERGLYDPFHTFVDPNGYTLSDKVWRNAIEVRNRIDKLLEYHIAQGTSAVEIAELLEDFLTPGAGAIKTNTPYGTSGNYATRRLARTETTAAAGRATIAASEVNPFVDGIQWRLSVSHKCCDICDVYAAGGENADGVYTIDNVPQYPAHPNDMCSLLPVVVKNSAALVEELRQGIQAATPQARNVQGLFNTSWLTNALLNVGLGGILEQIGLGV